MRRNRQCTGRTPKEERKAEPGITDPAFAVLGSREDATNAATGGMGAAESLGKTRGEMGITPISGLRRSGIG